MSRIGHFELRDTRDNKKLYTLGRLREDKPKGYHQARNNGSTHQLLGGASPNSTSSGTLSLCGVRGKARMALMMTVEDSASRIVRASPHD